MTEKSCLVAEVSSRTVDIMHKRQLVLLLAFALVFLVGCSPSSKGPYDAQADPSAEFAGGAALT